MSELTLDDARRVTAAAEGKALDLGRAVTITVTDASGHVRAQTRLPVDGRGPISQDHRLTTNW